MTAKAPSLMRRHMNDPRFDYVRPRRARRLLVGISLIFSGAIPAVMSFDKILPLGLTIGLIIGLTLTWCIVIGMLNLATRGVIEVSVRDVDERERAIRGHIAAMLWWPCMILMLAAGAAMLALPWDKGAKAALLAGAWFVAMLLPLHWAAWTLPDEPAEDV